MAKKSGTTRDGNAEVSECAKQAVPATLLCATLGWWEEVEYLVDFGKSVGQERDDMM